MGGEERRGRAPLEVWRREMLGGSPVRPREEVAWRKGEEAAARAQRWILPDLHRLSKVSVLRGGRGEGSRPDSPRLSPPDFGGKLCGVRRGARLQPAAGGPSDPARPSLVGGGRNRGKKKQPLLEGKVAQAPLCLQSEGDAEERVSFLRVTRRKEFEKLAGRCLKSPAFLSSLLMRLGWKKKQNFGLSQLRVFCWLSH